MNKIIILNGPNLNLLGERESNQYGTSTLSEIEKNCNDYSSQNNIKLSFFQSNIEGEIVEQIQFSRNNQYGLIINAGGYTHTSVAIHDALKILKIPIIELHISNIYNREEFRHKSLISKVAKGIILHNQDGITLPVFKGLTMQAHAGECVALAGPSGMGKSTLMRMIYGNYLCQGGQVEVLHKGDWVDIAKANARDILQVRRWTLG